MILIITSWRILNFVQESQSCPCKASYGSSNPFGNQYFQYLQLKKNHKIHIQHEVIDVQHYMNVDLSKVTQQFNDPKNNNSRSETPSQKNKM